MFNRNIGTKEQQTKQFPPHKIIGNMYYVGTETLGSFLVVTPAGNILIDSTYEANVPVIRKSIEDLGFKFSDTKILLGSHAHADHQEGDAMVKELTGAQANPRRPTSGGKESPSPALQSNDQGVLGVTSAGPGCRDRSGARWSAGNSSNLQCARMRAHTAGRRPAPRLIFPAAEVCGKRRDQSDDEDGGRAAEHHRRNRAQPLRGESRFHGSPLV